MKRRTLLAGTGLFLGTPTGANAQSKTNGIALVIGNSRYRWEAPLPNVSRDVRDVASCFRVLGLETELVENADQRAMNQVLTNFGSRTRGVDFAAFYFAGHGATWNALTHLVPIDADLSSTKAVASLIKATVITDIMEKASHSFSVLDSCRSSPADSWHQRAAFASAGGFSGTDPWAPHPVARNALSLLSTAPGRVAQDGPPSGNSPFASLLLRQLAMPPVDLRMLGGKLRRSLFIGTQGKQFLWVRDGYDQPFLIGGNANRQGLGDAGSAASLESPKDGSKIVEFTNVYAHALQIGVPLPQGLVGYLPANVTDDGRKIGAYKFMGLENASSVLIVLTLDESGSADVILGTRLGNERSAWRLAKATVSGNSLEIIPANGAPIFSFKWRDSNSGKLTMTGGWMGGRSSASDFARLDG